MGRDVVVVDQTLHLSVIEHYHWICLSRQTRVEVVVEWD
jgi:hypothetical protein